MLRILVVDDEPIIADGLHELLSARYAERAEVLRTYSAWEAMRLFDSARIDVIISDIEMPRMDGIALMNEVRARWPYCRIIFLTGHDEFRYAYQAISGGVSAFILKTETDDRIIAAVDRCIDEIVRENDSEEFLRRLQQELDESRILMQRETVWAFLKGKASADVVASRLEKYGIPLSPKAPSVLICGRADNPAALEGSAEKQARVRTLFYQYTRSIGRSFLFFEENDRYLHGLLQPRAAKGDGAGMLSEALERMQEACVSVAGLEISLIVDDREVEFEQLPARFAELSQFVRHWLDDKLRLQLLQAGYFAQRIAAGELADLRSRSAQAEALGRLRSAVETEDRRAYGEALAHLHKILAQRGEESPLRMEVLAEAISILMGCINRRRLAGEVPLAACISLQSLFSRSPEEICDCLQAFGGQLFSAIESAQRSKDEAFVEALHEYVDEHMSQSITLFQLARHAHFNSAYLSRLYKQISGVNLSDAILERKMLRASELLRQSPHLKIGEVAGMVGFEYPAYFARVFKKRFGVSPQEFKEKRL